jgi:hypothetical protein
MLEGKGDVFWFQPKMQTFESSITWRWRCGINSAMVVQSNDTKEPHKQFQCVMQKWYNNARELVTVTRIHLTRRCQGTQWPKDANKNTSQKKNKCIQLLSIFIILSFTTTPLTTNCSNIICHTLSFIPIEGEYRPSLKDCLGTSGSSSEAPTFTSNKILLVLIFVDDGGPHFHI